MDGIRLVASDLDGTLLLPDETVSERTRAALAAAKAAGVTVVLVSGRQPRSLGPIAERIGVGGIAICANGALIWDLDAGTILDATPLAAELAARLVHALRDAIPGVLLAVELEGGSARSGLGRDPTAVPPEALRPRLDDHRPVTRSWSATRLASRRSPNGPAGPWRRRRASWAGLGWRGLVRRGDQASLRLGRRRIDAAESWPSANAHDLAILVAGTAWRWPSHPGGPDAATRLTAANVEDACRGCGSDP